MIERFPILAPCAFAIAAVLAAIALGMLLGSAG